MSYIWKQKFAQIPNEHKNSLFLCSIIYRMSEIKNNIYVGFDFSMNKPAATIYSNGKLFFYLWALNLTEKKLEMYRRCGVNAMSRNLDSIDTKAV